MEFNEKLQQLRKEKNLTQEQLAEKLFISRTAISKWESGKAYPNIESLKLLSKVFSVSIDDLLSSDELISLAEEENQSNINKITSLFFAFTDLLTALLLFLPIFTQRNGELIQSVNLLKIFETSIVTGTLYFSFSVLMILFGLIGLIAVYFNFERLLNFSRTISIIVQAIATLFFIGGFQPYPTAFIFVLFVVKVVLLLKKGK